MIEEKNSLPNVKNGESVCHSIARDALLVGRWFITNANIEIDL